MYHSVGKIYISKLDFFDIQWQIVPPAWSQDRLRYCLQRLAHTSPRCGLQSSKILKKGANWAKWGAIASLVMMKITTLKPEKVRFMFQWLLPNSLYSEWHTANILFLAVLVPPFRASSHRAEACSTIVNRFDSCWSKTLKQWWYFVVDHEATDSQSFYLPH